MKDSETRKKFIELRAKGISFSKIAKELKVSKSTLIGWSKEHLFEIENLKAVEIESLQEQFYISKRSRIELLGQQVERMKKELEKRDFSDVPSDKLLDALNKTVNQLRSDEIEVIFKREGDTLEDLVSTMNTVSWKP